MIDLHCDTISVLFNKENESLIKNSLSIDKLKLETAGSLAQFFACFVDLGKFKGENICKQGFLYVLDLIKFAENQFLTKNSNISLAKSYSHYIKNCKEKKISAFLTVEEGGIIENDISKLNHLYNKGIRLITLCWNYENCIGFPNGKKFELMQKGLKPFGFEVVEKMNDKGIIIDVSHLSDQGFFNVINFSKKPVIASHSNSRSLCPHPRNLTDEMIKALAEKGGIAGVNFYPFFLVTNGKASLESLAEHIKYMQNVGGEDFVAIGTDFDGFDGSLNDIKDISQIEKLFKILKSYGFTPQQIEKIKLKNAERIIKEIL